MEVKFSSVYGQVRPHTYALPLQNVVLWGMHCSEQGLAAPQNRLQTALLPLHIAVQLPVAAPQSTEQLALPLQLTLQSAPVQRK